MQIIFLKLTRPSFVADTGASPMGWCREPPRPPVAATVLRHFNRSTSSRQPRIMNYELSTKNFFIIRNASFYNSRFEIDNWQFLFPAFPYRFPLTRDNIFRPPAAIHNWQFAMLFSPIRDSQLTIRDASFPNSRFLFPQFEIDNRQFAIILPSLSQNM